MLGLLALGFALAPMRSVGFRTSLGQLELANVVMLLAAAVTMLAGGSRPPSVLVGATGRYVVAVSLMAIGTMIGTFHGFGIDHELIIPLFQLLFALVPVLLLIRLRVGEREVVTLMRAYVAGTVISCAYAAVAPRTAGGFVQGFTGQKNQLALTVVTALPLVRVAIPQSALRVATYAVLLYALNESSSRAGLLALIVIVALFGLGALLSRPSALAGTLFVVLLAIAVKGSLAITVTDGAIGRLAGSESASRSDVSRAALRAAGFDALRDGAWLAGVGNSLSRHATNVPLELWVVGGLTGLSGFVLLFSLPVGQVWRTISGRARRWPPTLQTRVAISLCAYLTMAMFNNLLWSSFLWCLFALLTTIIRADRTSSLATSESLGRSGCRRA